MGGYMAWGKCVIISLGLMLITHVAYARDIDTFTDSQGTLHITNIGSTKPTSPVTTPHPAASLQPGGVIGKAPVTPPARALAPAVQAPAPKPGPAPRRTNSGGPAARFPGHPYRRFRRGDAGGRPERGAGRAGNGGRGHQGLSQAGILDPTSAGQGGRQRQNRHIPRPSRGYSHHQCAPGGWGIPARQAGDPRLRWLR